MQRFAILLTLIWASTAFGQTIRVTTWNMQWFPAGSNKPVEESVEAKRIQDAATFLKNLNPDVLLVQEIRDWETCEKLAAAMKPSTYHVLVCTGFKEPFGSGLAKQQVAIIAKKPAQAAWSEDWKSSGKIDPPRGFAYAAIRFGNADVGFYSVHLKSNLIMQAETGEVMEKNITKREIATLQLVNHAKGQTQAMPTVQRFIVAGDFNTNLDQPEFAKEQTLLHLEEAGFQNAFGKLGAKQRVTHPGEGKFPDATFDYVFVSRGCTAGTPRITKSEFSDHFPVTCDVALKP